MSRRYGFASGQTIGTRERQEDAVGAAQLRNHDGVVALVLADGMGGHAGGNIAANVATRAVLAHLKAGVSPPWAKLKQALKAANDAIRRVVDTNAALRGMGCTLIAATVTGDRLRWISVGDSPLMLVRGGRLSRLNADHSMRPVFAEMVERGQLRPEEARRDPGRNALRSAVSGSEIEMIDAPDADLPLRDGDLVLLISDGIETLDDDEIAALARTAVSKGPKSVVEALLRAVDAYDMAHQDNASVVAYIHADRRSARPGGISRGVLLAIPAVAVLLLATWAVVLSPPAIFQRDRPFATVSRKHAGHPPSAVSAHAPKPNGTLPRTGPAPIVQPESAGPSHGVEPASDAAGPAPGPIAPNSVDPRPAAANEDMTGDRADVPHPPAGGTGTAKPGKPRPVKPTPKPPH